MSACALTAVPGDLARPRHERHRPERTLLHALVRRHLPAFLRLAEERYERPLPLYVRRAFEHYLKCGIPEHGFLRLRCDDCGHDRVVAFSCKERGTCPSCAGRIMANTGAHIVDRVLPNLPIRQWVLSLPFDLRARAAKEPSVVSAIDRILVREVERFMRRAYGPKLGRAGAITFVQRFGGSLNLHVHFHVLFVEGLFTRDEGELPVFHRAHAPTRTDLYAVLTRVRDAVQRHLRRGDREEPASAPSALDACAQVAVQRGLFDVLPTKEPKSDDPEELGKHSVALDGFNLHAAVSISADDDVARERLVRYCARPPFALDRFQLLPDGRVAYRIKQPRRNATHRILEPVELLARIAALIPPPRHPSVRYHGVLAPSSKWRAAIVPRPLDPPVTTPPEARESTIEQERRVTASTPVEPVPPPSADRRPTPPTAAVAARESIAHGVDRASFARHTAAHRHRLAPDLFATSRRLEWSKLLRRTFAAEVLECPRCRGKCTMIGAIQDPTEARRFLAALDQLSTPPLVPPLRQLTDEDCDCDDRGPNAHSHAP
ncbi:MAG: transposase, partial [Polyangiales bacterium]